MPSRRPWPERQLRETWRCRRVACRDCGALGSGGRSVGRRIRLVRGRALADSVQGGDLVVVDLPVAAAGVEEAVTTPRSGVRATVGLGAGSPVDAVAGDASRRPGGVVQAEGDLGVAGGGLQGLGALGAVPERSTSRFASFEAGLSPIAFSAVTL